MASETTPNEDARSSEQSLRGQLNWHEVLGILSAGAIPLAMLTWLDSPSPQAQFGAVMAAGAFMVSYYHFGVEGDSDE